MHIVLQTMFAILWIAGLIAIVVGIWYCGSLLLLGAVSRWLPLTGRRTRPPRQTERSSND